MLGGLLVVILSGWPTIEFKIVAPSQKYGEETYHSKNNDDL